MRRRAPLRQVAIWALRVGVSAGIVAYILVDVDHQDLARALTGVRPSLVAWALVLYLFGQVLSALKWGLLARSVGLVRPPLDYLRFYFIGMFFNLFGPSTVGGDVARGLYLGAGRRPGLALNSVLFDRMSGLAVLMALGAVAMAAYPQYAFPWPMKVAVVGGGFGLLLGWWTCPWLVRLLPRGNPLRRQIENELAPFWRDSRLLLAVVVISVAFHLSQVYVQYIIVRAVGATVPFSYCLVYHPLLSVMMALPVSLGGFGVREGGYLYFLTRIDIDDSIAVTTGLLWWALTVCAGLVGAAFFALSGAPLPRLWRPAPEQTERAA